MADNRLVYVVDDEDSIRRAAGFLLKTSGYAVETWESGTEFLRHIRHLAPGCILLDIRMPGIDGLEVQQALRERGIAMPVIVLTGHGDISIAVQAMKAGALEFLEKPISKERLITAIEAAHRQIDNSTTAQGRATEALVVCKLLTARERQVLDGLAQGLPNKTIAFDLGISSRTVEVHRANLMLKLNVHSLSDALRIAFAAGLGG